MEAKSSDAPYAQDLAIHHHRVEKHNNPPDEVVKPDRLDGQKPPGQPMQDNLSDQSKALLTAHPTEIKPIEW